MGFVKEFKEFAMRGNVLDMAVGVVIGAAFGKIVSSLVADVFMPILSVLTGGVNFTDWKFVLKSIELEGVGATPSVTINYGNFLQVTFDFLIVAFVIFLVIKTVNKVKNKIVDEPVAPVAPPEDIELLKEIRDLLKK